MSEPPTLRTFKCCDANVSSYAQMTTDHPPPPVMTSFSSRKRVTPDSTSSDMIIPLDGRLTSSPYPNRSLQRNGNLREADLDADLPPELPDSIGQRYNRKSNVIRIDARNHSDESSLKRDGTGSIKHRQAPPNCSTTPAPVNESRYASLSRATRDSPTMKPQPNTNTRPHKPHPGQASGYNFSQLSDPYIGGTSVVSRAVTHPQQNRAASSQGSMSLSQSNVEATQISPGVPQGDTLPYTHKPRSGSSEKQRGNLYENTKSRCGSRVTFAKPETARSSANAPPIKQQKNNLAAKSHKDEKERCDKSRSKLLCCVTLILVILLFITICLLIYFVINSEKPLENRGKGSYTPTPKPPLTSQAEIEDSPPSVTLVTKAPELRDTCLKKDFLKITDVLSKLDNSVNPCEDFYSYACGGWIKKNYVPPGNEEFSVAGKIKEDNSRLLHELLLRDDFRNITQAEAKAKLFYLSCIDVNRIETLGYKPLIDLLNSFGGWDALGTWDNRNWDLSDQIFECQGELGLSVFFSIIVLPNNATSYIPAIGQDPPMTLTLELRNFYFGESASRMEATFKNVIRTILQLLNSRNIDQVVDDIYEFEKQLAKIHLSDNDVRSKEQRRVSISRLGELCPQINWFRIFRKMFTKVQISGNTKILLWGTEQFFSDLSRLINNSTTRALHNYMMWRIVFTRVDLLSLQFRRASTSLQYDIREIPDYLEPRWSQCLRHTKNQFKEALGVMYARERFSVSSKLKVENMVRFIRETLRLKLSEYDWLNDASRGALNKQFSSIDVKVGFKQEYVYNPKSLDRLYEFDVDSLNFFDNFMESLKFKVKMATDKVVATVDSSIWPLGFEEVNIELSNRKLFLPAGILQPPYFDSNTHDAVNYGSLGSTISRQILRAYGVFGDAYDVDRTLRTSLSANKMNNYTAQLRCVEDKYSFLESRLIGAESLHQYIADMGGVKIAYEAYKMFGGDRNGRTVASFSNSQLFFIGYAQAWCTKRTSGIYFPEGIRIFGSLSQFDKFSEAFRCARNSPMNSERKCSLW